MADTKITALTALTAADPANDVIPIVDVSDTTMAASGTTKKISVNNILSSSPTASGALTVTGLVTAGSATITGDLTVDTSTLKVDSTNNRVGIGTASPGQNLDVQSATGTVIRVKGGSGSGQGSAFYVTKAGSTSTLFAAGDRANIFGGTPDVTASIFTDSGIPLTFDVGGTTKATIDSSGNLGLGVVPSVNSLSASGYRGLEVGSVKGFGLYCGNSEAYLWSNLYYDGGLKYANSNTAAASFYQNAGQFIWYNAPSSGASGAGTAATLTPRMTLDASGRLFVGATAITAGFTGNNYLIVGGVASPTIKLQSTTGPNAWDIYTSNGADLFVAKNSSDLGSFSSTTGVYTPLSDANKKRDFEPSNIGLAEVLQLQPKLFRMVDDADDAPKTLGFVAQDVKNIIPQAYVEQSGQNKKFIGLQDRPIIAALTRAIQELTARVQTLEAR
jgi:hypothetical protein